jgi:O-antigen/teichoic acid export membrane protein
LLTLLQADSIILGMLGGAALVADYVLIWKVADVGMQALWRLPESLVPYLIHMDAKGDHARMRAIYSSARKGMVALSAVAAVGYAIFGQAIVELWVGAENAPDLPWGYALAGGALFWMVVARLPAIYAFATIRMKPLVAVLAFETIGKVILLLALFPILGILAPLLAVNVVHVLGVAYFYQILYRSDSVNPKDSTA